MSPKGRDRFSVTPLRDPRRVRLQVQGPLGYLELELAPLEAALLAGRLFLGALESLDPARELGVHPEDFSEVRVWWLGSEGQWICQTFTLWEGVARRIEALQEAGMPYRVTLDLLRDPLEPKGQDHG